MTHTLVLTRQLLAMVDNSRLLEALSRAGAALEHVATHDALTDLPNRALFSTRLDRALLTASSSVCVLFCDLDNFKPVNDELGHAAGDELLRVVAERLTGCVRDTDTVARLGGDEFAVVLLDCPDPRGVADRVVGRVGVPVTLGGRVVTPSVSVGLAEHRAQRRPVGPPSAQPARRDERPDRSASPAADPRTAALLLRMADVAMYAAKAAGKGRAFVVDVERAGTPRPV